MWVPTTHMRYLYQVLGFWLQPEPDHCEHFKSEPVDESVLSLSLLLANKMNLKNKEQAKLKYDEKIITVFTSVKGLTRKSTEKLSG